MIIDEWLKDAKGRIAALDAELIALRAFAPAGADRSWLVAHGAVAVDTAPGGGAGSTAGAAPGLEGEGAGGSWLAAHGTVMAQGLGWAEEARGRREAGEPLAYILGEKEFYGRTFTVTPDVLIPRPETESLVELAKQLDLPPHARLLEIGTGSGCVAITLALEFPQAEVLATDAYLKALDIAAENNFFLEGRVRLLQSNLLRDLRFPEEARRFDVLVANLPYVDPRWDWLDEKSLAFEPKTALFAVQEHGLSFYKRLLREMQKDGAIYARYAIFEADPCQHEELVALAEKKGYELREIEGYGLLFERRRGAGAPPERRRRAAD